MQCCRQQSDEHINSWRVYHLFDWVSILTSIMLCFIDFYCCYVQVTNEKPYNVSRFFQRYKESCPGISSPVLSIIRTLAFRFARMGRDCIDYFTYLSLKVHQSEVSMFIEIWIAVHHTRVMTMMFVVGGKYGPVIDCK
jgi:hypothetical protein